MLKQETSKHHLVLDFHKSLDIDDNHRYKSWEHCYNAFQCPKDNELQSLHLGFYLASWGMYRGSSGLLQKDYTIHIGAVDILQKTKYKPIHFTNSNPLLIENKEMFIELILELKRELSELYKSIFFTKGKDKPKPINPTDTLITKIMLGTLGCTPAYDRYYIDGLKNHNMIGYTLNKTSLNNLFIYIENNLNTILSIQNELNESSDTFYPIMKIMDMYFWSLGMELEIEEKAKKELEKRNKS